MKRTVIILAVFWCVPMLAFASGCSSSGATVVYVNGIETTQKDADNDTESLRKLLLDNGGAPGVQILTGYNPTHLDGTGDLIESITQAFNVPVSDFDLDTILDQTAPEVTTQKLLLVGHSQGTFYTNEMYDYLIKSGVPARSIAVYNLATPASFVAGGGTYLTSANDKVINYVREEDAKWNAPQALPANIIIPEEPGYAGDAWGGHEPNVYLGGAPQRIAADIERMLVKLSAGPDTAGACFAPPSLGIAYDMQQAAFDAADPVALGLDAAAADARTTIASVITNENDILHTAFSDVVFSVIPKPTEQNAASAFAVEKALYGSSLSVQDYEALLNGQDVPEVAATTQTSPQVPKQTLAPPQEVQQVQIQLSEKTPPQSAPPQAVPTAAAAPAPISPGFGGGAPTAQNLQTPASANTSSDSSQSQPPDQTDATTTQEATSTQADSIATTTLAFSIRSPADQTVFSTTSVAFTGTTSPSAAVFAAFATTSATTTADENGNWSFAFELPVGTTTVSLSSADSAGDVSATTTRTVGVTLAIATSTATTTEASALVEVSPQNPCGQSSLTAHGYFFSAAKDDADYSAQDFLQYHFEDLPQYSDGRSFTLTPEFFNDQCYQSGPLNPSKLTVPLPAKIIDWSVRFTSRTHFDVWDDTDATTVAEYDIPVLLPNYTSVEFAGSIDGSASTIVSRGLEIFENGEVPTIASSIAAPSSCAGGSASGYFFDTYEHAEYVGGLLRVHLRLLSPYNDGRSFLLAVEASTSCPIAYPGLSGTAQTALTPFIRYFSFRMTSPTHWVLWDDENDTQIACTQGCEGDVPSGTAYVSLYASVDAGASTLRTTAYPPTGP